MSKKKYEDLSDDEKKALQKSLLEGVMRVEESMKKLRFPRRLPGCTCCPIHHQRYGC